MKKLWLCILIILVLSIGVGTGLLIHLIKADNKFVREVKLESEGETVRELEFSVENFLPGDVAEYLIIISSDVGGDYDFTFSCQNVGGELWKYLNIEICCGEAKKEVAFADLFEGGAVKFETAIADNSTVEFVVRYIMPEDVGNEAQNQTADFILLLNAQRE